MGDKISWISKTECNKSTRFSLMAPVGARHAWLHPAPGRVSWRMRQHDAQIARAWAGLKPAPTRTDTV